jgi:D,D-heptose 1,7-bisphosphate phosphatase
MRRAVFLDKDGTLILDIPYNIDTTLIKLYEHTPMGLSLLRSQGYMLILISNQPGIAKGFFEEDDLQNVYDTIQLLLKRHNILLDAFYYCPHYTEGVVSAYVKECGCRKPAPGLLLKAARENNIDLTASWMVGDILNDVEAGNRAGCKTILIDNSNETEWHLNELRNPVGIVKNMEDAAKFIIASDNRLL